MAINAFANYVRNELTRKLQESFEFPLTDRLQIIADVEHYKASEDESVWLQKQGKAPTMFEVYWDGVWLIDFATDVEIGIVIALFWQGFRKAYEEKRISLMKGALMEPDGMDFSKFAKASDKNLVLPKTSESQLDRESNSIITEIEKERNGINTAPRPNA